MPIVLVPRQSDGYPDAIAVNGTFERAFEASGADVGIVVCDPVTMGKRRLCRVLRACDGLLLPGDDGDIIGDDGQVEPSCAERVSCESGLIRMALDMSLPVLGVCRGMQLMNVMYGGALAPCQSGHISDDDALTRHEVTVSEGSSLASVLVNRRFTVNSAHRQSVPDDGVGFGLRVAARADDGTVEALELNDRSQRFLVGVQWHPEKEPYDEAAFCLLRAFAAACCR